MCCLYHINFKFYSGLEIQIQARTRAIPHSSCNCMWISTCALGHCPTQVCTHYLEFIGRAKSIIQSSLVWLWMYWHCIETRNYTSTNPPIDISLYLQAELQLLNDHVHSLNFNQQTKNATVQFLRIKPPSKLCKTLKTRIRGKAFGRYIPEASVGYKEICCFCWVIRIII